MIFILIECNIVVTVYQMQNRGATKMDNFDLSMFLFGLLNGIPWGVILALIVIASCGRRRKNEKNNDNFRNDK